MIFVTSHPSVQTSQFRVLVDIASIDDLKCKLGKTAKKDVYEPAER